MQVFVPIVAIVFLFVPLKQSLPPDLSEERYIYLKIYDAKSTVSLTGVKIGVC